MGTIYRWYAPHDAQSALDAIENVKGILSFLADFLSQDAPQKQYMLSEAGATGLYSILVLSGDVLEDSMKLLAKGVR